MTDTGSVPIAKPQSRRCASCGWHGATPGAPWKCPECDHRNDPAEYIEKIHQAVRNVEMLVHYVRVPAKYSPHQEER